MLKYSRLFGGMVMNYGYNEFIKKAQKETKNAVIKAMEIYASIKNKTIMCGVRELKLYEKVSISLFLASFLIDCSIKDIMTSCNIDGDIFFNCLKINKNRIKELNYEDYIDYFKEFKYLLYDLLGMELPFEKMGIESLFRSLMYDYSIKILYEASGLMKFNNLYETKEFKLIYEMLKNKSISRRSKECLEKSDSEEETKQKKEYVDLDEEYFKNNGTNNSTSKSTPKRISDYSFKTQNDSILEKYGEDLIKKEYISNPAISREEEIKNLIISLLTFEKSAVIVGEAGVGKTAIVEGLAYMIKKGEVPNLIKNIRIVKMNVSSLLQGCIYVGMFESRVEELVNELMKNPNVYLFIDELHNVIGAGSGAKKDMDLANMLKPYLDRGQIKIIGATTEAEYDEYIGKDLAFKRRFEKIVVKEPKEKTIKEILIGSIFKLEKVMNIKFVEDLELRDKVLDLIIESTDYVHRVYNDVVNNPDISLTILKKAFAYAIYNNQEEITLEDIANSIKSCDRLNESSRERYANLVLNLSFKEIKSTKKILEFKKR